MLIAPSKTNTVVAWCFRKTLHLRLENRQNEEKRKEEGLDASCAVRDELDDQRYPCHNSPSPLEMLGIPPAHSSGCLLGTLTFFLDHEFFSSSSPSQSGKIRFASPSPFCNATLHGRQTYPNKVPQIPCPLMIGARLSVCHRQVTRPSQAVGVKKRPETPSSPRRMVGIPTRRIGWHIAPLAVTVTSRPVTARISPKRPIDFRRGTTCMVITPYCLH
ncbi:hypothetical protein LX36DRAFT_346599 [Colletotrichum falcatum]|nr:hypothetical protein LX36DRAFT_346599 [Colletotrichum falcatum]